jgi:hypothetical protein
MVGAIVADRFLVFFSVASTIYDSSGLAQVMLHQVISSLSAKQDSLSFGASGKQNQGCWAQDQKRVLCGDPYVGVCC